MFSRRATNSSVAHTVTCARLSNASHGWILGQRLPEMEPSSSNRGEKIHLAEFGHEVRQAQKILEEIRKES
jgi:hypothetical protein